MTERLVIRDRQEMRIALQRFWTLVDRSNEHDYDGHAMHPATARTEASKLFDALVSADFSGLYEGGTELPKEEATDTQRLDWYDAHALKPNIVGGSRVSIFPVTEHIQVAVACGSTLREAIDHARASLIDSSVSPPQQTETPK